MQQKYKRKQEHAAGTGAEAGGCSRSEKQTQEHAAGVGPEAGAYSRSRIGSRSRNGSGSSSMQQVQERKQEHTAGV